MIRIVKDGIKYPIEMVDFPNGEKGFKFDNIEPDLDNLFEIEWVYDSDAEFLHLQIIMDYIFEEFGGSVIKILKVAYMPYSRMDRKNDDFMFSLSSAMKHLNRLCFTEIHFFDLHSKKCNYMLGNSRTIVDKLKVMDYLNMELSFRAFRGEVVDLVLPDEGAHLRYEKQLDDIVARYDKNIRTIHIGAKTRDFETGKITDLDYPGLGLKSPLPYIIVDDLCARGGTFAWTIELFEEQDYNDCTIITGHCENTVHEGDLLHMEQLRKFITSDSILTRSHPKMHIEKCWRNNE